MQPDRPVACWVSCCTKRIEHSSTCWVGHCIGRSRKVCNRYSAGRPRRRPSTYECHGTLRLRRNTPGASNRGYAVGRGRRQRFANIPPGRRTIGSQKQLIGRVTRLERSSRAARRSSRGRAACATRIAKNSFVVVDARAADGSALCPIAGQTCIGTRRSHCSGCCDPVACMTGRNDAVCETGGAIGHYRAGPAEHRAVERGCLRSIPGSRLSIDGELTYANATARIIGALPICRGGVADAHAGSEVATVGDRTKTLERQRRIDVIIRDALRDIDIEKCWVAAYRENALVDELLKGQVAPIWQARAARARRVSIGIPSESGSAGAGGASTTVEAS